MNKLILIILFIPVFSFGQSHTISGYIKDAENGESLIGATIVDQISKKGAVSNVYGFFSLTLDQDSVNLAVSFVGYGLYNKAFPLSQNTTLNISLQSGGLLNEIVITAKEDIVNTSQMSTIDVPIHQLKSVPALLGESDVLKTLQLLPGIQGGTEGSSGIYVRGGGPDQNLILLDGVPIYNASHLFGFFSIFNADAVNNVSVIKGGFPARYGGRLSSVVDVSLKEGNNKKFSGSGSIGLISSKLTLEGPIKNEKTSFLLSGRRTYIDLFSRPISLIATKGDLSTGYFFHDYIGKINHRFSDKDRLFLSTYFGKDKASANENYKDGDQEAKSKYYLEWGNIISSLRWNHLFTPKLFGNLTTTFSQYRFELGNTLETTNNNVDPPEKTEYFFKYFSGIRDFAAKFDLDYSPNSNHNVKGGVQGIMHTFSPGVLAYKDNLSSDTTLGSTNRIAYEAYIYAEDDFRIGKKIKFNVGAHYSTFYVDNDFYHSFQPRVSGRFLLGNNLSLKASYAEMAQYIHLLNNGGIGLPTDLWVPTTKFIKPQYSQQLAVGIAKGIGSIDISIEGYYKKMQNLVEYREGASYISFGNDWEDKIVRGNGTSKGVEVLIQKKVGKFNGWIGYTLSKTTRQFEELNQGKEFPYKFDRRHDASIVAIYELNDRIKLSSTWVYGTGNAITMPHSKYISTYNDNYGSMLYGDVYQPTNYRRVSQATNYGSRNSYRLRAYNRLDLSISFTKQKKRFLRTWSFGAYNVYNRKNPFYIDIQNQNINNIRSKKFVQYSLFPIVPFFQYSIKF